MLRRSPTRASRTEDTILPMSTLPSRHKRPSYRRARRTSNSSNTAFKVIVAAELVFLTIAWTFFSGRLLASPLWKEHLNIRHSPKDVFWERRRTKATPPTNGTKLRLPPLDRDVVQRRPKLPGDEAEIPDVYRGPTLIIGGSDGSGTRAFAHYVRRLGVPMRVNDKETFDAHGSTMFNGLGWPPLGKMILNATHSANYELDDLPADVLQSAKEELDRFKTDMGTFGTQFYQHQLQNHTDIARATGVSVGFKAPITMLLLPLLKEVFGKIKYVHIARDGRDVSVSTNKSPVQKFYESMYVDAKERLNKYANGSYPVLAMHLWNDWNTQAYEWEQAHADDDGFDFLVLRSEDLVDPEKKLETLGRLAAFVGSPLTTEELCCMSREGEIDMGMSLRSSDRTASDYGVQGVTRRQWDKKPLHGKEAAKSQIKNSLRSEFEQRDEQAMERRRKMRHSFAEAFSPKEDFVEADKYILAPQEMKARKNDDTPKLHQRYGKWKEILEPVPEMAAKLHEEGAKGLTVFGYEPPTSFHDSPSPINNVQCDAVGCGAVGK